MNICWLVTAQSRLAERCARALRGRGWRLEHAASTRAFSSGAPSGSPGVALIDLREAWPRPAQAVSRLRAEAPGWRIVLLAGADDAYGPRLARALESGADDVLPETLQDAALAARLAALATVPAALLSLEDGAIRLDRGRRLAWAGSARPRLLPLTRTEFELLALLLEGRGRPVARQQLIDRVWRDDEVNAETVDRHIGSLRRKLKGFASRIRTAHGYGYAAA
ncbi:MAG: response regulator transcription factor [Elusimicrobia bacterium]|nr:response regulator transcription factor [Elusimicrobiota bacterium]